MKIILHHCHESRSMRSLWLLHELQLDFELVIHAFDNLRTADYLSVHPLARVPALQIDGKTLFESGAICQYLCEKFSPEILGRSSQHPERSEWLQWLHYSETMAVHGSSLAQQLIVIQDAKLRSPVVQKLESRRLQKSLEVIETQLRNSEYLLTSGFSAADIAVGYSIHLAHYFVALDDYPEVASYYEKLTQRTAFKKSMPAADEKLKIFNGPLHVL